MAEVQLGGSAELEVKNGASLLVDGSAESVWGPDTNVAINNGGSLGGTGTIRVQGGIFFASPNTGSVLTSGAGGNGHMVVEGHALVVANGLGVEGGYQLDVAAGGSLRPRGRTRGWRPSPAPPPRSSRGHARAHRRRRLLPDSAAGQRSA